MRRKHLIVVVVSAFIVVEVAAIFFALWSDGRNHKSSQGEEVFIRIGLMPVVSRLAESHKWEPVLDKLKKEWNIVARPYFAQSIEEIIHGFEHDVLDVAFINSAIYDRLKENDPHVKAIAYLAANPEHEAGDCSVIVSTIAKPRFLEQTKKSRMTFTNKHSLTGYIVPKHYLEQALGEKNLDSWFSKIRFAGTDNQAILDLYNDKTDLVAVNYAKLKSIVYKNKLDGEKLRIVWMLRNLPPEVLCVNQTISPELNERLTKAFLDILSEADGNSLNIRLNPINDNRYDEQLKAYRKFVGEKRKVPESGDKLKTGKQTSTVGEGKKAP